MKHEIRSLTGIRGIAALWVMGFHILSWMPNRITAPALFGRGEIAVDIFFLLSGFIMMRVHGTMSPKGWPEFFVRRIFRIYPLHLAIIALLVLKVLASSHPTPEAAAYFSWATLPYVATLTSLDFGFNADHWNAPTWSLDVEMACYVLFPLAALLIARVGKPLAAAVLGVMLACACLSVTSFSDFGYFAPFEGIGAFARGAAEFLSGALLCQALSRKTVSKPWIECAAAVGLIACIASPYPMFAAIFATLLVGALSFETGPVSRLLASRPIWWSGQISLSLYLVHTPICHILQHLPPKLAPHLGQNGADAVMIGLMYVVSLAASVVTYRLIERPGQKLGKRLLARRKGHVVLADGRPLPDLDGINPPDSGLSPIEMERIAS